MFIISQFWWLWLTIWLVGLGVTAYFQISNMKKIQAMDLDGVNQAAPVIAMLVSGVGFILFAMSAVFWILITVL